MNKTVPWSIKGVGYDTREAAKEAARLSGQSLGDWLDAIIAERASKLGVSKTDMEEGDRLAAVAAELHRMSGAPANGSGQSDPDAAADEPAVPGGVERRDDEARAEPARRMDLGQRLSPAAKSVKGRSIQDVVAEIARRQAVLDAEDAIVRRNGTTGEIVQELEAELDADFDSGRDAVSRNAQETQADAGANWDEVDDAVSALEARLEGGRRQPRTAPARAWARSGAGSSEPRRDVMPFRAFRAASQDSAETMSAFDALGRELRQAIKDIDARPVVESLDRQMRDIGRKVEGISAELPSGTMLSRIGDQTKDVRDLLSAAVNRPSVGDNVERQIASIDRRLSQMAAVPYADGSDAEHTLVEMKALLDRFRPGSAIESLERRMEDLAVKIDRGIGTAPSSRLIEDLARRVEEIHTSLRAQIASPVADQRSMEGLVRGIADRIDETREASSDISRLESLMRSLAAKIEDGTAQADVKAISTLEQQIGKLADRLERSEASFSALDAVEHSLGELFSQLEETRHAAIDAAENAARTAARDTLRAAMQNPPLAGRSPEKDSEFVEQVTHELSELRVMQDASDRRTQATLSGLHQAMEKLVQQLGELGVSARQNGGTATLSSDNSAAVKASASALRDEPSAPIVRAEPAAQVRGRAVPADESPAAPVDPIDSLIEPGSGRGPRREGAAKVAPGTRNSPPAPAVESEGPASFIAAARRAAQAAQASAAAAQKPIGRIKMAAANPKSTTALSTLARARSYLVQRRRPILLSLAGLVLLLGALQVVRLGFSESDAPVKAGAQEIAGPSVAENATPTLGSGGVAAKPAPKQINADAAAKVGAASQVASSPSAAETSPAPPETAQAATAEGNAPVGTIKGPARNMNPFLAGIDLGLRALPEGLRNLAQSGDGAAQYEVALRFAEGRGVTRDVKAAAVWFEKAAGQGLAPAQYRLGSAFEKGTGEARDPELAMAWYGKAAEAGNMRAMHNLAVMAAEGAVGKPDYAKAATWFQKAAALGIRDSQFNLAILYARGLGIEQSLAQSYTWFAIAASQGDDDAAKKRDEVAARLDAKTLAAAKAAADGFKPGTAVSAANEVAPPPGGWDAVAPSKAAPSATKGSAPKVTVM